MVGRATSVWRLEHKVRPKRRRENAIDPGLLGGHRREAEHRNAPLYSAEGLEQHAVALRVRGTQRSSFSVSQPESRSEERRVGKECRFRCWAETVKKEERRGG